MSKVQVNVRLDADVATALRAKLIDPVTKRTRYRSMSALIEHLLLQWITQEKKKDLSHDK